MNAMFQVKYIDKTVPYYSVKVLSLCSPDLKDPRKAYSRARKTAKERLARKLGSKGFRILSTECVG